MTGRGEGGRAPLPPGGLQALEQALPNGRRAVPHAGFCPSPPPHASPPSAPATRQAGRISAEARVEETLAASDPWGVRPLLSILILSPYLLTLTITQVCEKGKKENSCSFFLPAGWAPVVSRGSCAGGCLRDSGGSRVCGPERSLLSSLLPFLEGTHGAQGPRVPGS